MRKSYFVLLMTSLLLSCSSFTQAVTPTPSLAPIPDTPSTLPEPTDRTQVIAVRANETFDIVLPANPSTGYAWQITNTLDANLIQPAGQTYVAEQPVIPGSGGVDVWTFRALAPGETAIEFGYFPPGDNPQPEETGIFTIRIE